MLVRQTHGDVTAAPTSRVIFQRGRRGRTVDDDTRRTGVLLCDCYQLVIQRDLDAPTRGAEPYGRTGHFVALVAKALRLKRELDLLRKRHLGATADRGRLVLDDRETAVLCGFDGVAASNEAETR